MPPRLLPFLFLPLFLFLSLSLLSSSSPSFLLVRTYFVQEVEAKK